MPALGMSGYLMLREASSDATQLVAL
jgi:hypothetical protein